MKLVDETTKRAWAGTLFFRCASGKLGMNGFDRKTVILKADADTTMTLEADIDGCGTWVTAAVYSVKANQEARVDLPPAFAAYWVRARADRTCTATVQFLYR